MRPYVHGRSSTCAWVNVDMAHGLCIYSCTAACGYQTHITDNQNLCAMHDLRLRPRLATRSTDLAIALTSRGPLSRFGLSSRHITQISFRSHTSRDWYT